MVITAIEKKKGSYYSVYVDDEYFYSLHLNVVSDYRLKKDMVVDEEFLEELKTATDTQKAKDRAFYLLGYRAHSTKELYDKLKRNYSEEVCDIVVAKMLELRLLDDEEYAQRLAEGYLTVKKLSYNKAVFEMRRKGIDRELAEYALNQVEIDASQQIKELLATKYYRKLNSPDGAKKVAAALARLGFSYSDIKSAMSEHLDDNEYDYE